MPYFNQILYYMHAHVHTRYAHNIRSVLQAVPSHATLAQTLASIYKYPLHDMCLFSQSAQLQADLTVARRSLRDLAAVQVTIGSTSLCAKTVTFAFLSLQIYIFFHFL